MVLHLLMVMISVTHDETGVLNVWMLELLKKKLPRKARYIK
jgi:hypothetical protein